MSPTTTTGILPKATTMPPEVKVISKFTLVPITLVVASIAGTFAVCNWLWVDKTRIALVENKQADTQRELRDYKIANDQRMQKFAELLGRIDKNVAVIAAKNDIRIDDTDG